MKFQTVDGIRYLSFDIFPRQLVHGVFTRHGGLSPAPWNSLNVGGTVGDETERVRENRYRSFAALGRKRQSIFDVWQIHSSDIVVANAPHARQNTPPEFKADGIVTDNPAVSIFMRFADCTPVLLYDPQKKVAGLVHAGWQGTVKRAAGQAIKTMQAVYNSKPENILAAIGPAIGPDHYEIGPDVIEQVRYSFGDESEKLLIKQNEKIHFDLWAANKLILEQAGVYQVEVAGLCTACHLDDWYSHRGQKGKTGRFGVLMSVV
jgi:polyphenol oxidase